MTKHQAKVRFFIVDGGRARLMECERVQAGRVHVEEIDAIEYEEELHEHGRPSPRVGKAGNSYASAGHEDDHQLHRFAKQVTGWMERHANSAQAEIPLFSPPRFLGEMRKLYGTALAGRIREHQADLAGLSTATLAKHAAIEALLR